MIQDYFYLALGNLKHRGLRSFLTILGILIGITAVVSLISLGEGLKSAVNSQFGITSTQVINVQAGGLSSFGPPGSGVVNPLTKDDVEAINRLNSVEIAVGRNIETVKLEFNDKLVIQFVVTLPDDKKGRDFVYEVLEAETISGKLVHDTSKKVVLGNDYAFSDTSRFDKALKTGDKIEINGESFEVSGILKKKGSFIVDSSLLIPESRLNEITGFGENVDVIGVLAKDRESIKQAKEDIEKLLRERRNVREGEEDFEVSTPEESLQIVNQVLLGIQIFIVLIASISIIVGAVGIVNTMTTSVLERKKEIGIMKAVGAKNSDIFYQFFIEAGLLGLTGGIIGVIFGTGIGYFGTKFISDFLGTEPKIVINMPLIFFTLIGSFIIGSVSGIVPALRAAKLNPIDALRG